MAKKYSARAVREGRYWVVTADPGGLHLAGQVRRLDDAVPVMQSIVAAALDVSEESLSIDLDVQLPADAADLLLDAQRREADGRDALAQAGRLRRDAIATLRTAGLNQREVAQALGLSPQRVSQLARAR
jgi:DNA-directed RNA polymerase specialized sigma24 family protein